MVTRKKKIPQIYIAGIIILLVLLTDGFFVYKFFIKPNNYLIENKYYGFKLQTPKGWSMQENTSYSDDNINSILTECKNSKLNSNSGYEIGAFRIENKKIVVLEISIKCIPENNSSKNGSKYQIKEYMHKTTTDKKTTDILNKIISSFSFTR